MGFSVLSKDTLTHEQGRWESNVRSFDQRPPHVLQKLNPKFSFTISCSVYKNAAVPVTPFEGGCDNYTPLTVMEDS